ncbi:MAG: twin-arginine translocase TatA/TatE family subunit [Deltaproteobacteria bacterium]|nr:twin-arginine translocase TatA/TatE family subunit [Deltaproteobacteria bacterium]
MFGISFEELLVLLVLALILFGPEKLPEFAEKMGRWVAKLRQTSEEVSQHFQQAYHSFKPANPLRESPSYSFCPQCGQKLEPGFVFCPSCGRRLPEDSHPHHPLAS